MSYKEFFAEVWGSFVSLWEFRLLSVGKDQLLLGQLIVALFCLVAGLFVCRMLSRAFERKILEPLNVESALRHTVQTFVFYMLLVVLILFVMSLLKIPLTAFTLVGGAVAVGVGLGAQNIVKNFLSGLVLMVERPLRVGDYIQKGELSGKVEHIGARSTIMRSLENIHIVVPNSDLLEHNITNWTLSDDLVRVSITVGAAYGSDTKKLAALLKEATLEQNQVLKHPEPIVLFHNFGDNALEFQVHYWAQMRNMFELRKLSSQIRFRIDETFREHNIVIAFPQRDVHLDTPKPIQVEVLKS